MDYILTPSMIEILNLLAKCSEGICLNDISKILHKPVPSISNLLKKMATMNPNLFYKKRLSRYCYYYITEEGKSALLKKEENNNISRLFDIRQPITINQKLAPILIKNILDSIDANLDNPIAYNLKALGIETIMNNFSFGEFIFLCLILGIISKPLPICEAINIIIPDTPENNSTLIGKIIFNRLKMLINSQLFDDIEVKLFIDDTDLGTPNR